MTVTTNGVAVTLETIQAGDGSTRIEFSVPVPADLTPVSGRNVVGFSPTTDIEINGSPLSPYGWANAGVAQHTEGETTTSFWVVLESKVQLDKELTISLKQFVWLTAPGTTQAVKGPWAFKITQEMRESQPLPTPNPENAYFPISMAVAQRLVDFPIIQPNPLPGVLLPVGDNVMASVRKPGTGTKPNFVTWRYQAKDSMEQVNGVTTDQLGAVTIYETTNKSDAPTSPPTTIQGPNSRTPEPVSTSSTSGVSIHGVTVKRLEGIQGNIDIVQYVWQVGRVYYVIYAQVGPQITDAVLQQMISSMIEQSSTSSTSSTAVSVQATPNPSGSSSLTFEELQQIAPFYVAQPSWVPLYLIAQGGDTAPHSDPSHPPVPIQSVVLYYGPAESNQHFSLEIDEFVDGRDIQIPGPTTTTTLNVSGYSVSRTSSDNPNSSVLFRWQDQGTTFLIRAQIDGPLTEQDVEHMIASMLSQGSSAATPAAVTTPTPAPVPFSQADAIWSQVVRTINGGIDPILKPSQLPDGFDSVKLVSIAPADVSYNGPPSFDVEYSGPDVQLDIVVGMLAPSLCGSGCTQSQITLRGQQATIQVNDAVQGHISRWWREPGTWNEASSEPPVIQYWVFAQGLSADQVEQVVESMNPVND